MGHIAVSGDVRMRDESGRFIGAVQEGAVRAAEAVAEQVAAVARMTAPKRRGLLALSVEARSEGVRAWATADAPYAAAQEEGAGPHDIPGSFGRDFPWGFGAAWGRPGAWHPGNPATHFLLNAGTTVSAYALSIVERYMP
jgi:hypothetical protein